MFYLCITYVLYMFYLMPKSLRWYTVWSSQFVKEYNNGSLYCSKYLFSPESGKPGQVGKLVPIKKTDTNIKNDKLIPDKDRTFVFLLSVYLKS